MSLPAQLVLRTLLEHPSREMYALQLCTAAGLRVGTIHPLLARFESMGWLDSRWEDVDSRQLDRPRRRLYRLSEAGAELARERVHHVQPAPRRSRAPLNTVLPGALS